MSLAPGSDLGPYRIVSQLGAGGMGVVYTAHDPRLDRHVAIKVLPPDLTRDGTAKQRFLQEAKAASALDHPNICTIYEINETADGQLYLVMAYYEGETLKGLRTEARLGQGEKRTPSIKRLFAEDQGPAVRDHEGAIRGVAIAHHGQPIRPDGDGGVNGITGGARAAWQMLRGNRRIG